MSFEEFWTRGDVHERVNIALKEANLLEKKLEIEDLFPLDQYHARGIAATIDLADKLNFAKNSRRPDTIISLVIIIIAAITSKFFIVPFMISKSRAVETKILSAMGSRSSPSFKKKGI